jgi:SAM-dependent methyltransferase
MTDLTLTGHPLTLSEAKPPQPRIGHTGAVRIHRAAEHFDTAATAYERARPGYPEEAIAWLAEQLGLRSGRTVLDLAAGTGKLTRALVRTGARVIAVEPVAGMRAHLTASLGPGDVLDGTAEAIPLPDASVDAVTVAQAFHWFDPDRAPQEIHRVTRPGAKLAVVYNRRVVEDPVQAGLEEIISPHRGATPAQAGGGWRRGLERSPLWRAGDRHELVNVQRLSREDVVARALSTSFIAGLPDDLRQQVIAQVRELVADVPEPVPLPYSCELSLWERAAASASPRTGYRP